MTPTELLVTALVEVHPTDAARALERLRPDEAAALVAELDPERATAVLARMETAFAATLLAELDAGDGAEILAGLAPPAAATVLRRLPPHTAAALLAACPPGFASSTRAVLAHPPRSAGALMDPHAPSLPRDLTAAAALAVVRERPERFKHYIYVVDRDGKLAGVTRLLDLVAAGPEVPLEDLLRTPVARIHGDELEVAVVAHPGWTKYTSLPVVDPDERLIGVIRDDVVRSAQERTRADRGQASLAMSLAELFWLGLTGITEGMAHVVGRQTAKEAARPPANPDGAQP